MSFEKKMRVFKEMSPLMKSWQRLQNPRDMHLAYSVWGLFRAAPSIKLSRAIERLYTDTCAIEHLKCG